MLYQIGEEIMADNLFFYRITNDMQETKFPNVVESAGKDS